MMILSLLEVELETGVGAVVDLIFPRKLFVC